MILLSIEKTVFQFFFFFFFADLPLDPENAEQALKNLRFEPQYWHKKDLEMYDGAAGEALDKKYDLPKYFEFKYRPTYAKGPEVYKCIHMKENSNTRLCARHFRV